MSYTQTQLDALRAALAAGTESVSYDGRMVKYRSMADLRLAIAEVERGLGLRSAPSRITYPEMNRDGS